MPAGDQALQDMLAHILVDLLIGDVAALVSTTFWSKIEAQSKDEDLEAARSGKWQKAALKAWLKLKYPLAMGEEFATVLGKAERRGKRRKEERLNSWGLLMAIAERQVDISRENSTTEELGKKLVSMAKASSPRVKAPLVNGGLLHVTLSVALERLIRETAGYWKEEEAEDALKEALGRALVARKVEIVPHHAPAEGQSRWSAADPRWWMKLCPPLQVERVSHEELSVQEKEVQEAAEKERTPWKLPTKPQHVTWFLKKEVLPEEWSLAKASLGTPGSVTYRTYHWVQNNYDGEDPLHRMALLWSIMFSWVLPRVGVPEALSVEYTEDETLATSLLRDIPWEVPARKGTVAPLPYVVMVTCVIISFFEPESPLRVHLGQNDNKLGEPWTNKHSTSSSMSFKEGQAKQGFFYGCRAKVHQPTDADTDGSSSGNKIYGSEVTKVQYKLETEGQG